MDPLSEEALEERVALLVSGRFDELRRLTRTQDDQQDRQHHQRLADGDLQEVDLIDCFERWLPINQYAACHLVLPALGLSRRINATRIERLLRLIPEGDGPSLHFIAEALQAQFSSQPSLALDVAKCFNAEVPVIDKACRAWAIAYAMAQPALAAQFVVDRLGAPVSDSRAMKALATALPWRLDEVRAAMAPHLQAVLDWLKTFIEADAEDGWYCLVELAQFDGGAFQLVDEALDAGIAAAASSTARSIFRIDTDVYGANDVPLAGIVRRLVTLACVDATISGNVDLALSSCLRKPKQRQIAIDSLRTLGDGPDDALERFNLTFQTLPDDAALFKDILTRWLLSPSASFAVLRSMLNVVSAQRGRAEMDEPLFAKASPLVRTKAIRRLLGLLGDGPSLCQFGADVARMTSLGGAGLELATQMFNLLKDEFPGATEEFLKPLAASIHRRERGAPIFRGVYASMLRWKRHLERLPRRPELRISDADSLALRSARIKLQAAIHRGAEEMSVFASAVTKVHVAQGNRFASHMEDGPTAISAMGSYSHSIELPSSELSDPMRGFIHRMKMLENSR